VIHTRTTPGGEILPPNEPKPTLKIPDETYTVGPSFGFPTFRDLEKATDSFAREEDVGSSSKSTPGTKVFLPFNTVPIIDFRQRFDF
jgi:hypothetical protein